MSYGLGLRHARLVAIPAVLALVGEMVTRDADSLKV